uniref:Adenylosuccinate synthetase, chloroplastic n=1 Tax=Aegilops tauschii TaxID=37682 RepID=M8AW39_AEGTA
MDTFCAKLNTLMKDAAMRFKGFEYSSKTLKEEVDKYKRFAERLGPYITDTVHFMNESILQKEKILVEGGQATMLDIDFGTYPFVTSSSPSSGGICTGLGIAPGSIHDLIGVVGSVASKLLNIFFIDHSSFTLKLTYFYAKVKAYTTRVGSGPFPTELLGKTGDLLRASGMEFGTTTDGKTIESFPADLDLLEQIKVKYEAMPGWEEDISLIQDYNDLPKTARLYVERIEELVNIPVHYIGVGPGRDALIYK